jgi:hypothetical protein
MRAVPHESARTGHDESNDDPIQDKDLRTEHDDKVVRPLGIEPVTDGTRKKGLVKTNVEGPMVLVQTKTLETSLTHIYDKRLVIFQNLKPFRIASFHKPHELCVKLF